MAWALLTFKPTLNGGSMVAATAPEAVLLDDYLGEERLEDILETLAAYRLGVPISRLPSSCRHHVTP